MHCPDLRRRNLLIAALAAPSLPALLRHLAFHSLEILILVYIEVQQPITLDVSRIRFDASARERMRAQLGFGDDVVLAYVGKFGGIYHSMDAYLRFLDALFQAGAGLRAYIISHPDELARIRVHALFAKHSARIALQPPVAPEQLHQHLSACDVGVVAIPPTPSQAYRTPVKTAHYWAAGLPIIIPQGVSDDHRIASEEGVGYVVADLGADDARTLVPKLMVLRHADRQAVRELCMAAAMKHRDTGLMLDRLRSLLQCV